MFHESGHMLVCSWYITIIYISFFFFSQFGDTILIHAVKGGHLEVVQSLLKKAADVDIQGVVCTVVIEYLCTLARAIYKP